MGLFRKKKKKPKAPPPTTPTGIPLAPIHRPEPIPEPPPFHEADVAPRVHVIPQLPDYRGLERDFRPKASAEHQQYAIGNSEYSAQLRRLFDLTGPSEFALASEIVPVAAFLVGGSDSGIPFFAGINWTPAGGQFPMVRITYNGSGELHLDSFKATHVTYIAVASSSPATTADNNVTVHPLKGAIPNVTIRSQSAGGGLTTDVFLVGAAEPDGYVNPWGQVLLPGGSILLFGGGAANPFAFAVWGREVL